MQLSHTRNQTIRAIIKRVNALLRDFRALKKSVSAYAIQRSTTPMLHLFIILCSLR